MRNYHQVRLGRGGKHVQQCVAGNYIGVGYEIRQDLTGKLPDSWRDFNQEFIPVYLAARPDKTKIAAGLACGAVWVVSIGINVGDIVLCPDKNKRYHVGEVSGDYFYQPDDEVLHCRPVRWLDIMIDRTDMSEALRGSTGTPNTTTHLTKYADEIEQLIGGAAPPTLIATDETIEDPSAFAMEKHLEDFLVRNWSQFDLAEEYDIFEEDGELVGQQYPTDTGPIDIFAISKDKQTLLVIELKKGRASDPVVGQIQRYMGFVQEELAESWQTVKGIIIALEQDQKLRRAMVMTPNIEFYRYQISFKLLKG